MIASLESIPCRRVGTGLTAELKYMVKAARAPLLRTMCEFAEQEIVIPDGQFVGMRFRADRQPYNRLYFDAVDSGKFSRVFAIGPVQDGKSLVCFLIPILYHLFEIGETVIVGLPSMDMASDKWFQDILPIIQQSQYARYLPLTGSGSRGGIGEAVRFTNGTTLKFMSGGGSDGKRSAFTARVVVITEVDKMDSAGEASRETDKISQLEARTSSFDDRGMIYGECTVSIERGRVWKEYKAGTASRIVRPCPHCGVWVTPERKHLRGWQTATNEIAARKATLIHCPECGKRWTEKQRHRSNLKATLLHAGQKIDAAGKITGRMKPTDTLGFRWTVVDSHLRKMGSVGRQEYRAARDEDDEDAERGMRQFVWTLPYEPPDLEMTPLNPETLKRRVSRRLSRGMVPANTTHLTVGVDLRLRFGHYMVIAWRSDGTFHVVDYGLFEIAADRLGAEAAMMIALRDFADICSTGWPKVDGGVVIPAQVFVDSGYQHEGKIVYVFCRDLTAPDGSATFRPIKGQGVGQRYATRYTRPRKRSKEIVTVGDQWHIVKAHTDGVFVVMLNADYWKTFVHQRLATELGERGALTLFEAPPNEHARLVRHLTAEHQVQEFIAGRGEVTRWVQHRAENHWFDCAAYAMAASSAMGMELLPKESPRAALVESAITPAPVRTPDGRPFLVTER